MPTCWFARLTLPQTIVPPVTNVALLCSDYALERPLLNKLSSAARVEVASWSIARRIFCGSGRGKPPHPVCLEYISFRPDAKTHPRSQRRPPCLRGLIWRLRCCRVCFGRPGGSILTYLTHPITRRRANSQTLRCPWSRTPIADASSLAKPEM